MVKNKVGTTLYKDLQSLEPTSRAHRRLGLGTFSYFYNKNNSTKIEMFIRVKKGA